MSDPSAGRSAAGLARLRRMIAAMERGAPPPADPAALWAEAALACAPAPHLRPPDGAGFCEPPAAGLLPLGVAGIDAVLGGGLRCGAIHDARAGTGSAGALSAFALGLAARAQAVRRRPVLFVQQELAAWETGGLYGPGLGYLGLPPEALVLARLSRPQDVLFAMEEGLRCAALSVVLGEFAAPFPDALTATRRLALAARESGGLGFIFIHSAAPTPSVAATRWHVSPLPSPAPDGFGGLGPPRIAVRLVRNRAGRLGIWPLILQAGVFRLAAEAPASRGSGDAAGKASRGSGDAGGRSSRGSEDAAGRISRGSGGREGGHDQRERA